mmetsp:Transcript_25470/g.87397  ORF Transcript_25470/g.87397 Transcript_25470/m.87397 type:complete len:349 (-) Transcript_25470:195-1241(-)
MMDVHVTTPPRAHHKVPPPGLARARRAAEPRDHVRVARPPAQRPAGLRAERVEREYPASMQNHDPAVHRGHGRKRDGRNVHAVPPVHVRIHGGLQVGPGAGIDVENAAQVSVVDVPRAPRYQMVARRVVAAHDVDLAVQEAPSAAVPRVRHGRQRVRHVRQRVVEEGRREERPSARRVVPAAAGDDEFARADAHHGAVDADNAVLDSSPKRRLGCGPTAGVHFRPLAAAARLFRRNPVGDDAAGSEARCQCQSLPDGKERGHVQQKAALAPELVREEGAADLELALFVEDDAREQLGAVRALGAQQVPPSHAQMPLAVNQFNINAVAILVRQHARGAVVVVDVGFEAR